MSAASLDGVRVVLLDIEGTVSPASFVHDVLFPLSADKLPSFVAEHRLEPAIAAAIERVRADVLREEGVVVDEDAAPETLRTWIRRDRKHPALKDIQGRIWREAYESGDLVAPLYPDVPPAIERFRAAGLRIAIYSSGSILAQQLFFGHSSAGDLTGSIDAWFDLGTGPKAASESYRAIAADLAVAPDQIAFFTDSPAEVTAALAAGVRAFHVVRADDAARAAEAPVAGAPRIGSFELP